MPAKNNHPYGEPRNVPNTITFRAGGSAELQKKIQAYIKDARELVSAAKRVNEEAAKWMSVNATKELRSSIAGGGREQGSNPKLTTITEDHRANSTWDENGFVFYDKTKMDASEVADYYRVIERGDKQRYLQYDVPLIFFNGGRAYGPSRERRSDRGVYAPGSNFPNVAVIRHDFGGYHYVARARERFIQEKIYRRLINEEAIRAAPQLARTLKLRL